MNEYSQDYQNNASHAGTFFAGLLVGGLVGATTMLMLAPQSGKKTRRQIQQKSMDLREQTTEELEDVVAKAGVKARHVTAEVRKQTKELEHRGQILLDEQKKSWSTLVEAGKSAVHGS